MRWLAVIILLTGCITPERAVKYLKDTNRLADTCAENYPVLTDTAWLPGQLVIETQWLPGDTLYFYDTLVKWKVCPPHRVVYYRIIDTLRIKTTDSAAVIACNIREKALRAKISDGDAREAKLIERLNKAREMAVYSLIANALLVLLAGIIIGKRWK